MSPADLGALTAAHHGCKFKTGVIRGNAQGPAVELGSKAFATTVQASSTRLPHRLMFTQGHVGSAEEARSDVFAEVKQRPSDLYRLAADSEPDNIKVATNASTGKGVSVPVNLKWKRPIQVQEGVGSRACALGPLTFLPPPSRQLAFSSCWLLFFRLMGSSDNGSVPPGNILGPHNGMKGPWHGVEIRTVRNQPHGSLSSDNNCFARSARDSDHADCVTTENLQGTTYPLRCLCSRNAKSHLSSFRNDSVDARCDTQMTERAAGRYYQPKEEH